MFLSSSAKTLPLAESVNAEYQSTIYPSSRLPADTDSTLNTRYRICGLVELTAASWDRRTVRISHVDRQLVQVATLLLCLAFFTAVKYPQVLY